MSFKIILVICSLEWNISEQTIFLPLINCCWNFYYKLVFVCYFKWHLRSKGIKVLSVCGTNSCTSDNQSEYSLNLNFPPEKTDKCLSLFLHGLVCSSHSLDTSSFPLHTSPPPTGNSSMCGRWCALTAAIWLLLQKDCPEDNNQCKWVWEKSNKFHLPINFCPSLREVFHDLCLFSALIDFPWPLLICIPSCYLKIFVFCVHRFQVTLHTLQKAIYPVSPL